MQKEYLATRMPKRLRRDRFEGDHSQSRTEGVAANTQDRRRLLSEARADLRLMSGTMTNSRTVTFERSTP
jgi:hypothetical protein